MDYEQAFEPDSPAAVDEIFSTEPPDDVMQTMSELAEQIAIEDDAIKQIEAELTARKEALRNSRTDMYNLLMSNNCANGHKFDNGILIKPKVKTRIFKAAGVDDEVMFSWLEDHNLGAIIKRHVPWQTLSSTMKAEIDRGRDLDTSVFNQSDEYTVAFAGNGKAKFLAARKIE